MASNLGGEDLETIIKRKGKGMFTNNSMIKVPKEENPDDVELAYKKDQALLKSLL